MKVLVAFLCLAALAAAQIASPPTELDGTYTTNRCWDFATLSAVSTTEFFYPYYKTSTYVFTDDECQTRDFMYWEYGNITLGNSANPDGTWNIDYAPRRREVTVYNATALTDFIQVCNLTSLNIQIGLPIDLSHVNCPAYGLAPIANCPIFYDIVELQGTALRFSTNGSCNANQRPTTLAPYYMTNIIADVGAALVPPPVVMDGVYSTRECEPLGPGRSMLVTLRVAYPSYEYNILWFNDGACEDEAFSVRDTGVFRFDGPSQYVSGAWNVDMTTRKRHLIFYSQQAMNFTDTMCGTGYRQLNVPHDFSLLNCTAFGITPIYTCPTAYEIMEVQEDVLRFGNTSRRTGNVCSPAMRPKGLSRRFLVSLANEVITVPPPPPVQLSGTYSKPLCLPGSFLGQPTPSEYISVDMTYPSYAFSYYVFSDSQCASPKRVYVQRGTFVYDTPAASTTITNGYNIILKPAERTITFFDSADQQSFMRTCGLYMGSMSRPTGVPFDVTYLDCPAYNLAPISSCPYVYDVFKVQQSQLFISTAWGTRYCSPSLRPTSVNATGLVSAIVLPTPTPTPDNPFLRNYELSGGVVFGVVIGVAVLLIVIGVSVRIVLKRRMQQMAAARRLQDNVELTTTARDDAADEPSNTA